MKRFISLVIALLLTVSLSGGLLSCKEKPEFADAVLTYRSNGDGTCAVVGVTPPEGYSRVNINVPDTSPDGDTVTAFTPENLGTLLPEMIEKNDFETLILDRIAKTINEHSVADGKTAIEWRDYTEPTFNCVDMMQTSGNDEWIHFGKLYASYMLHSDSDCGSERSKAELYSNYPICEKMDVYVIDPNMTELEIMKALDILSEYAAGWKAAEASAAAKKVELDTVVLEKVNSVRLPATVTAFSGLNFATAPSDAAYANSIYLGTEERPHDILLVADPALTSVGAAIAADTRFIASYAYFSSENLTDAAFPEGTVSIGHLICYAILKSTDIQIPASVTFIDDGALDCGTALFRPYTITFAGTVSRFADAIGERSLYGTTNKTPYTVTCSDGVYTNTGE